MLASPRLSHLGSRSVRFLATLGFAGVVAVAAFANHAALLQASPRSRTNRISSRRRSWWRRRPLALHPGEVQLPAALRRAGGGRAEPRWRPVVPRPDARREPAGGLRPGALRRRASQGSRPACGSPSLRRSSPSCRSCTTPSGSATRPRSPPRSRSPGGKSEAAGHSWERRWSASAWRSSRSRSLGALYLSVRSLLSAQEGRRRRSTLIEAIVWAPVAVLCVLPWARELPALLLRMANPPIFSTRNLSFRRVADGLGSTCRRRRSPSRRSRSPSCWRGDGRWTRSTTCTPRPSSPSLRYRSPGRMASSSSCRSRWRRPAAGGSAVPADASRRGGRFAERWGVPLALALIQASASAGVEFDAPAGVRSLIVLLPVLSPLALLAYLRGARAPTAGRSTSASQKAEKTSI